MKRVNVTICSEPETLGAGKTMRDLIWYGNNLAKLLEKEFSCKIDLHLGSGLDSYSDDQAVRERVREIESTDEWKKLLP